MDPGELERQIGYYRQRLDELAGQALRADALISRATREARGRRQALALLAEIERTVRTDMPTQEIYGRTVSGIQRMLKMDRAIVLEREPGRRTFRPRAWSGFDAAASEALPSALVEPPDELLSAEGVVLATKAARETEALVALRSRLGVPFFACVPVVRGGDVVALLLSGRLREARPFYPPLDEGDVATFRSIAGFLGWALENAALYARQALLARSFARFVPHEFLEALGRESVADVRLGDQVQREMTVLFADVRDFTRRSERMTPRENFRFVNDYLAAVAPVIRDHGGFIDKYIGDAIMALFPGEAGPAIDAAVALQAAVDDLNRARAASGQDPIAIGVGLHRGSLMLGTVGFSERMDTTVIADAVNLASRIEGLTKVYGASALLTDAVLAAAGRDRLVRRIDRVRVKGKVEPVDVFELLEAEPAGRREAKLATREAYASALRDYLAGDFEAARDGFRRVLGRDPEDGAAARQVERCEGWGGGPWEGVTILDSK